VAELEADEVPEVMARRTLSIRSFDAAGMMLDFLGESKAAAAIESAVVSTINTKIKSLAAGKMGYGTREVGDLIATAV